MKSVLVTGSSRGIGKAIAYNFAKEGYCVILNSGSNISQLQKTYEEFKAEGFNVYLYLANLAEYAQCVDMFKFIFEQTKSYPCVLVNNAGISYSGLFQDTTPDIWNNIINTNLNSAYHCAYLAVPNMIRQQHGNIINISSIWGQVGASCEVAYSTSKSALNGFTKSLAKELGPSNIRVNAIACGWIDTDMTIGYSDEDRFEFVQDIALGRIGKTKDVADLCTFLASDKSSYISGQIINLDGGMF
ncbi:short-chain dehydrogenase [Candidatus Epulonipiscium fishelsonii]|uniref:Short-chain dehydrogenase n=1 Tax=Candidatus Epulonipiscium fishelsonii TaxID=77094 RepID=A0ACC8XE59_9FIRM|nr:short-chain dehydrogenase [Epulopiscium sp. SCG-B11WGA-EpuloA1]ONI42164.1 short-chain dehydrogenase [Epulopiscium sp. SCG-B05WGA-EpuloA1]